MNAASPETTETLCCPRCGLTEADLRAHGRMGCAMCYETFRALVAQATVELHGASAATVAEPAPGPLPHESLPWPTRRAEATPPSRRR